MILYQVAGNCLHFLFNFQTTNYGLGGLCESHIDPSGEVMNKIELSPDKNYIKAKGDMIATLMAWLNTPKGKYSFLNVY